MARYVLAALVAAFLCVPALANGAGDDPADRQPDPAIVTMHHQMIYPAVQVQTQRGQGSGTVIFSRKGEDGEVETFIITNFHVVASAISIVEEYDYEKKEDVKRERREPVQVLFPLYNDLSRYVGTQGRVADIIAHDKRADLALLRLVDKETVAQHVASLLPEGARLDMGETVWAVGGGLGKPPFISMGVLGIMHERIDGHPYLLATAPIIFGNSGGALYHRVDGAYELVGIPSRVSASGYGQAVSHMAWSIRIETIREFLRKAGYGFVVGDEREEASEE